ncbi:MAG: Gfo/Idh/MocA family oxidoreductase [Clostridiaceae bacterium]|nr:Gfo/Idh/MocA family oxidoreductase [Clostridiaceae bacterium]
MKIGIIGARSKHVEYFTEAINSLSPNGSIKVSHIWGNDDPGRLDEIVSKGVVQRVFSDPGDLIKQSDAVIIVLRDGTKHFNWAEKAILAGKPVFIDKPFTCDPVEAEKLYLLSQEHNVAVTGGSTLCFIPEIANMIVPVCESYSISYKADLFSPYGGWYFYGSHLTDLCTTLFGGNFSSVTATLRKGCVTAKITYPGFTVTLYSSPEEQPPVFRADKEYILDDRNCYYYGMKHFIDTIKNNFALKDKRHLASVILLDAVLKSIKDEAPVVF